MAAPITHDQWKSVRSSLRRVGDRFTEMVVSAPDARAEVTPGWSVSETAAHLTVVAWLYTSLVRPAEVPNPFPVLDGWLDDITVDDIDDFNELTLRDFTERDPRRLAELLNTHIDDLLASTEDFDPTLPVSWLGGSRVPVAGIIAHLLNELLLHGHDMGRALGMTWRIASSDAAFFVELFMAGVVRHGSGRLLETGQPRSERPIAVEFRSPYITTVTMVLRDGRVTLGEPGRRPDVRVTFDPAVFNLMMFGRIGKLRALLSGRVTIGGPRPWLLPAFLRVVHMP
ncbi:maleylpyruvate isomerase N-terminal domain-containing protein [Streptosporangium sp. NPDC049376]|uniref:maleylpyruvate isomerase N-terminal domain-containing protein n=1 Tax=Streptosporangium sp. NPDC049376 TaxID=3366192 RepID=UPI003793871D